MNFGMLDIRAEQIDYNNNLHFTEDNIQTALELTLYPDMVWNQPGGLHAFYGDEPASIEAFFWDRAIIFTNPNTLVSVGSVTLALNELYREYKEPIDRLYGASDSYHMFQHDFWTELDDLIVELTFGDSLAIN